MVGEVKPLKKNRVNIWLCWSRT